MIYELPPFEVLRETPKAMLICVNASHGGMHDRQYWVPKKLLSEVDHGPLYAKGYCVPMWFAKQKGIA